MSGWMALGRLGAGMLGAGFQNEGERRGAQSMDRTTRAEMDRQRVYDEEQDDLSDDLALVRLGRAHGPAKAKAGMVRNVRGLGRGQPGATRTQQRARGHADRIAKRRGLEHELTDEETRARGIAGDLMVSRLLARESLDPMAQELRYASTEGADWRSQGATFSGLS